MKLRRNILQLPLMVLTSVSLMIGATPLRGEEFYDAQLRLGRAAMSAGDHLQAAQHCRIAAFGLMDRPAVLTEALVCMTLASSAAGREEEMRATLTRFLDVESRFGTYADAKIADTFRRSFESVLLTSVDRERLAAIPSLAGVGVTQPRPVAQKEPPPQPHRVEPEPPVVVESVVVETAAAPAEPAIAEPPPVIPEAEPAARVDEPADEVLIAARRLMNSRRPGDAAKILYRQLAKTPARRDLRLTLLEAAALNRDWRTASSQTGLLVPFVAGEEMSMFYAAVAAYETGKITDAKELLAPAKGKLPDNAYVKFYVGRITR